MCNRLNSYIIPEAAVHAFLTALFLINGYWIALILNLPLLAFNVKKYVLDCESKTELSGTITDGAVIGFLITYTFSTQPKSSEHSTGTRRLVLYSAWRRANSVKRGKSPLTSHVIQESFIKLGFHLILFFFYLYSMIVALIRDETH